MVDVGFIKPSNKIVCWGSPRVQVERKVESATSMYSGRLVKTGTTAHDAVIATPATAGILGWLGYEQGSPDYKPANVDTIWVANDFAPIIYGGGFGVVGSLTPNVAVEMGDLLAPWTDGELIPVEKTPWGYGIKIPFTKNTSQTDTGIDIPANYRVVAGTVRVTTAAGSATIDVGLGMGTESGFDADGIIDGLSCAAVGNPAHVIVDATSTNITMGALLKTNVQADGAGVYAAISEPLTTDGTLKSVDYTTSSHTIAGYILIALYGAGFYPVAKAAQPMASSGSSQDIMVMSLI